MLCQFLLYSKVNQLYVYIYPFTVGFPSHLGHHRALSRVPWAIQQVLISYLFYTQYQQCIYDNPNLPVHPTSPFPPWYPYVCSLHLCLYFCFVNKIEYANFFRFHIYVLIYDICFSLTYFTLFTVARTWKQPKCPSTEEWIKKMQYIYTMEYYSAIKRNKIGSFVEIWMDLDTVIQSELKIGRAHV